jgi:hypothetical protein
MKAILDTHAFLWALPGMQECRVTPATPLPDPPAFG